VKKMIGHTLTKLADAAFQQATQKVIERAEESGTPLIVWEHETVTEVDPRKTRATRSTGRRSVTRSSSPS
jgi:hypothetical protein